MDRDTIVCTNCVMDTSDPKIKFDDSGVCDHCLAFYQHTLPNWPTGSQAEIELEKLSKKIKAKGRGKEFDCIIGISGGIDSSYLTYIAKKKMGLKPLVFHVDGGWNSQVAVENINCIVDALGLDLYTEVIDWEEMKDLQLAYFKSGVPHIDTPQDHAFFAMMYHFAKQYDVKYILTGGNLSTECIRNPVDWMYYQTDSTQLKDIHKKFGLRPLINFPITSALWHKIYLPYFRGINVVRPLDLVEYNKEGAKNLLQQEFNWQPYKQKHFESRFTRFYESYWLPTRFNFDVRKVQLSSLILTKQMTREEALEILAEPPCDDEYIQAEVDFVSKKLGISSAELMKYMKLPLKSYRDFKSQSHIYHLGSFILKAFGIEVGGKR